jgi:ABC-type bacteriocin/lantibiotic exporter with double-glycine peptidase domain
MFTHSVINNIIYSNTKAKLEDVYKLADELGLHKLILSLPKDYYTLVEERGCIFSGGEKALVNPKKIILLD